MCIEVFKPSVSLQVVLNQMRCDRERPPIYPQDYVGILMSSQPARMAGFSELYQVSDI